MSENPIHEWFGLSYASYLVLPRTVMQSMPAEWQEKMVALLGECDDKFGPHYSANEPWWRILGVPRDSSNEAVATAYRTKAFAHHPDRGGNPTVMMAINRAYDQFKKERGV